MDKVTSKGSGAGAAVRGVARRPMRIDVSLMSFMVGLMVQVRTTC